MPFARRSAALPAQRGDEAPHVAWTAQEARQRALIQVTENIADYWRGGTLRGLV